MNHCSCPVGTEIRFTRQLKGLSLFDLEPIAGYTSRTLQKVEKLERPADCDLIANLSRGLNSPHLAKHYCNHECPVKMCLKQLAQ